MPHPQNFLLTDGSEAGELKACDFGLSTYFKTGEVMRDLVGSAYYVAPEVRRLLGSHGTGKGGRQKGAMEQGFQSAQRAGDQWGDQAPPRHASLIVRRLEAAGSLPLTPPSSQAPHSHPLPLNPHPNPSLQT